MDFSASSLAVPSLGFDPISSYLSIFDIKTLLIVFPRIETQAWSILGISVILHGLCFPTEEMPRFLMVTCNPQLTYLTSLTEVPLDSSVCRFALPHISNICLSCIPFSNAYKFLVLFLIKYHFWVYTISSKVQAFRSLFSSLTLKQKLGRFGAERRSIPQSSGEIFEISIVHWFGAMLRTWQYSASNTSLPGSTMAQLQVQGGAGHRYPLFGSHDTPLHCPRVWVRNSLPGFSNQKY